MKSSSDRSHSLRVATFNVRNVRALDLSSFWLRRRRKVGDAVDNVDADVWGMQEVYASQRRWLQQHNLPGTEFAVTGVGRNATGSGESVPIWSRRTHLQVTRRVIRWFGDTPERPGTKLPGAGFPRHVTVCTLQLRSNGRRFVVANTHLDERSSERRRSSLSQLCEWLAEEPDLPVLVMGDFNCSQDDPEAEPLHESGLRPVLGPADGGTSHEFASAAPDTQIDNIFLSRHWRVDNHEIWRSAANASDHWPVSANVRLAAD